MFGREMLFFPSIKREVNRKSGLAPLHFKGSGAEIFYTEYLNIK